MTSQNLDHLGPTPRRQYQTDDRRPPPERHRRCVVCDTPLGDRTKGETCPRAYARCGYEHMAASVQVTLPNSPTPMIVRAQEPSGGLQGYEPPMHVVTIPSLAALAAAVTSERAA